MKPYLRVVAIMSVVAVLLTACGGDGDVAVPAADRTADSEFVDLTGESVVEISVRDNVFVPERVLVSPGTEVRWRNRGRTPHNVVASVEGAFDDVPVDQLQPGDEAARVFGDPGDYPYYCSLHGTATRGQIGEIRVVAD